MTNYRMRSHIVTSLTFYKVWVMKYRYAVLTGNVQERCCDILMQACNSENVRILKGVMSKDHVHMHVEYPPSIGISKLVKKLTGRMSRYL